MKLKIIDEYLSKHGGVLYPPLIETINTEDALDIEGWKQKYLFSALFVTTIIIVPFAVWLAYFYAGTKVGEQSKHLMLNCIQF